MLCPNCKNEIPDDCAVCDYCGQEFEISKSETPSVVDNEYTQASCKESFFNKFVNRFGKKKTAILGGAFAAVVVLVVCCIVFFFGGGKSQKSEDTLANSAVYVSDGNLYYLDCQSGKPFMLYKGDITAENAALYSLGNITVSENGDEIFYFKNLNENQDTHEILGDLCVRSLKDKNKDAVVIDTNVSSYKVNEACTGVLYEKEESLYEYVLQEKKTSRVSSVNSASDAKFYSEDSYAYLTPGGKLYTKSFNSKETLISENTTAFYVVYGSEEIFFEQNSDYEQEFRLGDYVEYDIGEKDSVKKPEYPKKGDMSDEEYEKAYAEWSEEYSDYLDSQAATESTQELIDELDGATYSPVFSGGKAVYEYKAGKITLLTEYGNYYVVGDKLGYYKAITSEVSGKVKLSETDSVDDIIKYIDSNLIYDYYIGESKLDIPVGAVIADVNETLSEIIYIIPKENDEISGYTGDLYKASLNNGVLSGHELVDSDVCGGQIRSQENVVYQCSAKYLDGKIVYYKDYSNGTFDYYEDKQLIYKDALFGHKYDKKTNTFAYLKRPIFVEGEDTVSSLVITRDGKESEIFKGKIDAFYPMRDGSIVYSVKKGENVFDIYRFETKRPELVCENASQLVFTNSFYESENAMCIGLYISDKKLFTIKDGETERIAEDVVWISAQS